VLQEDVRRLQVALTDLQEVVDANADIQEALAGRMNSSGVFSAGFWTRAWAIYGHVLSVGVIFGVLFMIVAAMAGGF
jgi:hypothetical protein